jgi:hypothetical protein
MVVVAHPFADVLPQFADVFVTPQSGLLVFQAPPQALDQHVVDPAPFAIHAYLNPFRLDRLDPVLARELAHCPKTRIVTILCGIPVAVAQQPTKPIKAIRLTLAITLVVSLVMVVPAELTDYSPE